MIRNRQCCAVSTVLLIAAMMAGCGTPTTVITAGLTAAQVGTTAYVRGELRSAQLIPIDDANDITHDMLREVKMPVEWERRNERRHVIRAVRSSGRSVTITLEKQSPAVTRIGIRVGLLGDEAVSMLMFERLQEQFEAWDADRLQHAERDDAET